MIEETGSFPDWIKGFARDVNSLFQFMLFDDNCKQLRSAVRGFLTESLNKRVGAWGHAFPVKCDLENNPPDIINQGILVVNVAVSNFGRAWRAKIEFGKQKLDWAKITDYKTFFEESLKLKPVITNIDTEEIYVEER